MYVYVCVYINDAARFKYMYMHVKKRIYSLSLSLSLYIYLYIPRHFVCQSSKLMKVSSKHSECTYMLGNMPICTSMSMSMSMSMSSVSMSMYDV